MPVHYKTNQDLYPDLRYVVLKVYFGKHDPAAMSVIRALKQQKHTMCFDANCQMDAGS